MKRVIVSSIMLLLLLLGSFYFLVQTEIMSKDDFSSTNESTREKKINSDEKDQIAETTKESLQEDISLWLGKSKETLIEEVGDPKRKDLSAYGYTWWIYEDVNGNYLQFGIEKDVINTIYIRGDLKLADGVEIGQPYQEISDIVDFKEEVEHSQGIEYFKIKLEEKDIKERPLVKFDDDKFIQYYFDEETSELSSVRLLTSDVLLKHGAYEMEYRGELPKSPTLSEEDWKKVEEGMEQQIFDLTNKVRQEFNQSSLVWEDNVHEVAYSHSEDMALNNYFSHYGLDGESLKDRLAEEEINYMVAGENIAAQYEDAPATIEGWLNSEGHREALLNEDYTHLGVGVYELYYTQNFLAKP